MCNFIGKSMEGTQHSVPELRLPIVTARKRSWGKVICLQVCVCPQGGAWSRGGLVWGGPGEDPSDGY